MVRKELCNSILIILSELADKLSFVLHDSSDDKSLPIIPTGTWWKPMEGLFLDHNQSASVSITFVTCNHHAPSVVYSQLSIVLFVLLQT